MSNISYSNIVSDGLSFAFDTYSRRSYKGPPFQNKLSSLGATTGSGTGYVLTSSSETVNIPGVGDTLVTNCFLQNTGASWCCVNFMNFGNTGQTLSGSTVYTYLLLYRVDSGYTGANFMYRYEYNSSGTYQTESGVFDNSRRVHLGGGWYYAWGTFTTQPNTTNATCYSFAYNYSSYTDKYSWAKVAIVQGDYSGLHPKYWPNLGETRSNSQIFTDLVTNGTNTIEPFNLNATSYSSDKTCITLDGINQYLYTNGSTYWNAWSPDGTYGNSALTIELIFNSSDTGGFIISRPWNGSGQYNYYMTDGGFALHSNASGASLGYSSICTGSPVHMVWWMNSTQFGVYKNGEVYVAGTNHGLSGHGGSAGTNGFGTLFGSLYPYGEGWGGNTGFSVAGKYYVGRIYNRVLTAAEVKQNFNATRGRYGL